MTLFTIGPVQMYPDTLKTEGTQLPYFRTEEYGEKMKECGRLFLASVHAPAGTSFIALTASGTGGMDAAVQNVLNEKDRAIVINGGSFGERFAQITKCHGIPTEVIAVPQWGDFSEDELEAYSGKGCTALLVNACESGTGRKYDLDYLGEFCRRNDMLFIVDAVSAYLADPIDMESQNIDVLITASQKALALSPGIALVALSEKAGERALNNKPTYYFDFKVYMENQKRGQPPFTPAEGTMLALYERMKKICAKGADQEILLHAHRAEYFRKGLAKLPLEIPDIPLSNCCTPVLFPKNNASEVYHYLKDRYGLFLTPSGGALKEAQLRVGHLGDLSEQDFDFLLEKLGEACRSEGLDQLAERL